MKDVLSCILVAYQYLYKPYIKSHRYDSYFWNIKLNGFDVVLQIHYVSEVSKGSPLCKG